MSETYLTSIWSGSCVCISLVFTSSASTLRSRSQKQAIQVIFINTCLLFFSTTMPWSVKMDTKLFDYFWGKLLKQQKGFHQVESKVHNTYAVAPLLIFWSTYTYVCINLYLFQKCLFMPSLSAPVVPSWYQEKEVTCASCNHEAQEAKAQCWLQSPRTRSRDLNPIWSRNWDGSQHIVLPLIDGGSSKKFSLWEYIS